MEKYDDIGLPTAAKTSRLIRLAILALLTLGACVMTTMAVAIGRQGKASNGLSIISVSLTLISSTIVGSHNLGRYRRLWALSPDTYRPRRQTYS